MLTPTVTELSSLSAHRAQVDRVRKSLLVGPQDRVNRPYTSWNGRI